MTTARQSYGRMRTFDLPTPTSDGSAKKTPVARFDGRHYSAEREGDELVIYSLTDQHGMPAITGDSRSAIRTLADLNCRNAQAWRGLHSRLLPNGGNKLNDAVS